MAPRNIRIVDNLSSDLTLNCDSTQMQSSDRSMATLAREESPAGNERKGLTQKSFSFDGTYYQIPELQIRPRPMSHPEERFYASTISPESSEIMAKLGFGILIVPQRTWKDIAASCRQYCETALVNGLRPRAPIALLNVLVADDAHEAEDLATVHLEAVYESIENHYRFSDGHLSSVKGYEFYAEMGREFSKLNADAEAKAKAVEFFRSLHACGTPQQVLEKLRYIHQTVALDHMIGTFAFGGLPYPKLERSFKLFAEKVLPVLQKDPAFQLPKEQTNYAEIRAH